MLTHQTTSATAVAGKARVAADHTGKTDYDRFVFCLNLLGKRFTSRRTNDGQYSPNLDTTVK